MAVWRILDNGDSLFKAGLSCMRAGRLDYRV